MPKNHRSRMHPAPSEGLLSEGPILRPPDAQDTLGNQAVADLTLHRDPAPRQEGMGRAPERDAGLPLPILDQVPGGDAGRDAINDWLRDPYGLQGPDPKSTRPEERDYGDGSTLIPSPKKRF